MNKLKKKMTKEEFLKKYGDELTDMQKVAMALFEGEIDEQTTKED